jgi:hypothetical protein
LEQIPHLPPSAADDVSFGGDGCAASTERHRPDLLWLSYEQSLALVVEIDEDAHAANQPSCEVARMSRLFDSITTASRGTIADVVFVRVAIYNGRNIPTLASEVVKTVEGIVSGESTIPRGTGAPVALYVNYHKSAAGRSHVENAEAAVEGLVVV